MKILVLFLFVFPLLSFSQEKTLTIIGDSLSEGYGVAKESTYPTLVGKQLSGWKIVNSSVSGSTTASGPGRVTWALKAKPTAILIALGGNDGLRGLSAKEIEKKLEEADKLKRKDCLRQEKRRR